MENWEGRLTEEFHAIRKRTLLLGAMPSLTGVMLFIFTAWWAETRATNPSPVLLIVAGLLFAGGTLYCFVYYRCPRCGSSLTVPGNTGGIAFNFSAKACKVCGQNLA